MTVYCERDTQKPGNTCVKCGNTWTAGTPLPACDAVMGTGYGLAAFKAGPQPPLVEPLHCFPKSGGPFDMETNPPSDKRYEICVRCGNSWLHNAMPPLCPRDGASAPEVAMMGSKSYALVPDEIPDSVSLRFEMPRSILMDPVVRDLAPNEPFFILRGSDLLADYLVEVWARNAETQGCSVKTVQAARMKAAEMRKFSPRRYPA